MASEKCFRSNRRRDEDMDVVVPTKTRVPAIRRRMSSAERAVETRLSSRWSRQDSSQTADGPMRRKSMFSFFSLPQISSTARLVKEMSRTEAEASDSSSRRIPVSPKEVFPVPGGPDSRKKSRACRARRISSVKSAVSLSPPVSERSSKVRSIRGGRCPSNNARRSAGAERKACRER